MTIPDYLEGIYTMVEKSKSFGYKEVSNGAKLIGHVPHIASEAYFHLIFPPLSEREIDSLESQLEREIPIPLKIFYFVNNGISLFSGSLSIDGLRRNYVRQGDDVWQPFNIVDLNIYDAPPDSEDHQLFFGGYENDGSILYLNTDTLKVYRSSRETVTPLNEWSSFEEMLSSETLRLSKLFDGKGRLIKGIKSTVPE